MTEFTRITVVGSANRAELVVPSEEPFAALMPRLMTLLVEPHDGLARPLALVRNTGEQLDLGLSATGQFVLNGELLHLSRLEDAPAPPEVSDVTDAVADALRTRDDRWGRTARHAVAAAALGSTALVATTIALPLVTPAPLLPLAVAWAALLGAAILLGRAGLGWPSTAATALTLGATPALAAGLSAALLPAAALPHTLAVSAGVALGLAWLAIAGGFGVGQRARAALSGGLFGGALLLVPPLLLLLGVDTLGAYGIGGIAAAMASGIVPWFAVSSAGLTGLDDHVVGGELRSRRAVLRTADEAYRTLSWATAAIALALGLSGAVLVSSSNGWAIGLGTALAVTAALRTRSFPLALDGVVLWAAVALIALSAVLAHSHSAPWLVLAALGLAVVLITAAAGANPPAHARASLRRGGNLLEMFAVVSTAPLLLGVFGLYAQLLATF